LIKVSFIVDVLYPMSMLFLLVDHAFDSIVRAFDLNYQA